MGPKMKEQYPPAARKSAAIPTKVEEDRSIESYSGNEKTSGENKRKPIPPAKTMKESTKEKHGAVLAASGKRQKMAARASERSADFVSSYNRMNWKENDIYGGASDTD